MAVEAKRGCGYRKVGGIYLVADAPNAGCDRLPIVIQHCRVCGQGIKPTRGWTWVNGFELLDGYCKEEGHRCHEDAPVSTCVVCRKPYLLQEAGLLWIGEKFYKTSEDFLEEARTQGISRRIQAVPRNFRIGEHWVLLGCRKGKEIVVEKDDITEGTMFRWVPTIFSVFKPQRIEQIITESQAEDTELVQSLDRRHITPVIVPDDDPDHNPKGVAHGQTTARLHPVETLPEHLPDVAG